MVELKTLKKNEMFIHQGVVYRVQHDPHIWYRTYEPLLVCVDAEWIAVDYVDRELKTFKNNPKVQKVKVKIQLS